MIKIKQNCRYGDFIYNDCDFYIGKAIEAYGEFSESELAIFKQFLRPNMTVIEVGANMGALTVPIAKIIGNGKLYAIEPQKWVFYQLCANIVLNNLPQVECINAACGKEKGLATIPNVNYDKLANFGSLKVNEGTADYSVPLITIDEMNLTACDFIKIDAEGMDFEVLQGAKNTIQKHSPFINFEHLGNLDAQNWLNTLEYECHSYVAKGFNPNNWFNNSYNYFQPPGVTSHNVLCWPKRYNIKFR